MDPRPRSLPSLVLLAALLPALAGTGAPHLVHGHEEAPAAPECVCPADAGPVVHDHGSDGDHDADPCVLCLASAVRVHLDGRAVSVPAQDIAGAIAPAAPVAAPDHRARPGAPPRAPPSGA